MYIVQDKIDRPLHVVTTIFNPIRYKSRWKLYERFARYVEDSGAVLTTIEASFGERAHAVAYAAPEHSADPLLAKAKDEHRYIRVNGRDELWLKENLINLAIERLPANAEYIAWIDADVVFARPNWVGETIHQLQHYAVVQMFSEAIDLGPNYQFLGRARSFADCYLSGEAWPTFGAGGYYYGSGGSSSTGRVTLWHPGYAWAARRSALEALGGLMDHAILGSADRHMAGALIGRVGDTVHPNIHPTYRDALVEWQERADRYIRQNVGVVQGGLLHYWHGRKADRGYKDRWAILVDNAFDRTRDIKRNAFGLWQLCDHGEARQRELRDDIRAYLRSRNEDSIDVAAS